jgi:hypothetical protein
VPPYAKLVGQNVERGGVADFEEGFIVGRTGFVVHGVLLKEPGCWVYSVNA